MRPVLPMLVPENVCVDAGTNKGGNADAVQRWWSALAVISCGLDAAPRSGMPAPACCGCLADMIPSPPTRPPPLEFRLSFFQPFTRAVLPPPTRGCVCDHDGVMSYKIEIFFQRAVHLNPSAAFSQVYLSPTA